jgi:heptosyltransferase-2
MVLPLIRATEIVDTLIEVNERELLRGSFLSKMGHLMLVWKKLAGRKFDLILTLHTDPRYRLLSRFCRSDEKRHWGKIGSRYQAQEALQLIGHRDGPTTQQPQFPKMHVSLHPELVELVKEPLVVVAPGGGKNVLADECLKRWPIQSYAQLIQDLSKENIAVAVTGNEGDRWILPHLSGKFHNLIGKLDLLALIALLERSVLLITHDSGPLHLAKLAGCPTIALFGPTNPHHFVGKDENIKVVWGGEHLSCRPCYNGKTFARCANNVCLSSISSEYVLKLALELLQVRSQKT